MEKASQKVKQRKFWQRTLFVIFIRVTTLHSCEMKNALIFSQSKAHNVYIYIAFTVVDVFDFLSFWSYVSFISWEIIL